MNYTADQEYTIEVFDGQHWIGPRRFFSATRSSAIRAARKIHRATGGTRSRVYAASNARIGYTGPAFRLARDGSETLWYQ